MKTKIVISAIGFLFLLTVISLAQQTQVTWSSINNGFGVTTASNTMIQSLYGQPMVGNQQQGGTSVGGGFFSNPIISQSATFTKVVASGWNMIGLPNDPYNRYYLSLYPTATPGTLYEFDNGYHSKDTCDLGEGYWLKFPSATTVPVTGIYVPSITMTLRSGWNMIAGPACNVAFVDIIDPGGILVAGTLYRFNAGYIQCDTLSQGIGYWLRTRAAGTITLQCGSGGGGSAKLSVVELYESPSLEIRDAQGAKQILHCKVTVKDSLARLAFGMPPVAPAGNFDARFDGDCRAVEGNGGTIRVQSSHYPLTLTTTGNSATSTAVFEIAEMLGGVEQTIHRLKTGTSVEVADSRVKELRLTLTEVQLPTVFALEQNYPNPFNPTTTIRFALPKTSRVQLEVYNILGQRVVTLLNEMREGGYYNEIFDANAIASGVYIYRLQADNSSAVKKMLLIK